MLIDTHCHLEMKPLADDVAGVIKRAWEVDVTKLITIGTDLETSKKAVELAQRYPEVLATVGAHPEFANQISLSVYQELLTFARHPQVVAIGEIGLDFYRLNKASKFARLVTKGEQKELFEQMISIALDNNLPIIVHSRESFDETLQIIGSYQKDLSGGVFHCFSYDVEISRKFLDTGFFLSFTNIISYQKNDHLRKVVKFTPLDRILIETDAPFLPPENRRGQTSEPADVLLVAEKIAEIKKLTPEKVAEATSQNAIHLFGDKIR